MAESMFEKEGLECNWPNRDEKKSKKKLKKLKKKEKALQKNLKKKNAKNKKLEKKLGKVKQKYNTKNELHNETVRRVEAESKLQALELVLELYAKSSTFYPLLEGNADEI